MQRGIGLRGRTGRGDALAVALGLLAVLALAGCGGRSFPPEEEARSEYRRGVSLLADGKLLEADKAYWDAIQLDPELAEAYAGRGYILYLYEDYRPAMQNLNTAVALDPDLAPAYSTRGLVYVAADDLQSALLNFTRAIQLDPKLSEAYYSRAKVHVKNEDIGGAIDDMSTLIGLEPDVPRFYMDRATLYLRIGEPDRAAADLEQVLTITEDETWVIPTKQLLSTVRQAAGS